MAGAMKNGSAMSAACIGIKNRDGCFMLQLLARDFASVAFLTALRAGKFRLNSLWRRGRPAGAATKAANRGYVLLIVRGFGRLADRRRMLETRGRENRFEAGRTN